MKGSIESAPASLEVCVGDKNENVDSKVNEMVDMEIRTDSSTSAAAGLLEEGLVLEGDSDPEAGAARRRLSSCSNADSMVSSRELFDITLCFSPLGGGEPGNTDPLEATNAALPTTSSSSLRRSLEPVVYDPSQHRVQVSAWHRRLIRHLTIIILFLNCLAGIRALVLFWKRSKG